MSWLTDDGPAFDHQAASDERMHRHAARLNTLPGGVPGAGCHIGHGESMGLFMSTIMKSASAPTPMRSFRGYRPNRCAGFSAQKQQAPPSVDVSDADRIRAYD